VGQYQSGTFHQHMFLYKVDIDVLGTDNTLRVTRFPSAEIRAPWFDGETKIRPVPEHHYVANETESAFFPDFNDPMVFAFTNGHQTNWYELR
jgi:Cu2+-containing amine oxidase